MTLLVINKTLKLNIKCLDVISFQKISCAIHNGFPSKLALIQNFNLSGNRIAFPGVEHWSIVILSDLSNECALQGRDRMLPEK